MTAAGKYDGAARAFGRLFMELPSAWRLEFIRELEFKAEHDEKVVVYMEAGERPEARRQLGYLRALATALLELHNAEGRT